MSETPDTVVGQGAETDARTKADAEVDVLERAAAAVEPMEQVVDFAPLDRQRRLLLVHAHPDDESITTGATMARYAAEGALVALVTCTLGELGEVLVPELAHLAADQEDRLGTHRVEELAAAMEALRVEDYRFLGGPGRWRDSGMAGTPSTEDSRAFCNADASRDGDPVRELVAVIREVRPQVVVTYGPDGGYGHPDHLQAHRVTVAAVEAAADAAYVAGTGEPWQVAKLYWTVTPVSALEEGLAALREQGADTGFEAVPSADDLGFGVPDDVVTTEVDGTAHLAAKVAAMRAHATQISVDGPFFALSHGRGQQVLATEHYVLAQGRRGPGDGPDGREDDLFAGLEG